MQKQGNNAGKVTKFLNEFSRKFCARNNNTKFHKIKTKTGKLPNVAFLQDTYPLSL